MGIRDILMDKALSGKFALYGKFGGKPMILPVSKKPPFKDILDIIEYLVSVRYETADWHKMMATRLTVVAEHHHQRASRLCKIEEIRGRKGPEQLKIVDNVVNKMNDYREKCCKCGFDYELKYLVKVGKKYACSNCFENHPF